MVMALSRSFGIGAEVGGHGGRYLARHEDSRRDDDPAPLHDPSRTASFVMVHVGQSPGTQRNLRYGIETRSWGFPVWKPEYRSARPRFAVLATGVGPRVQLDVWRKRKITLYLFEVRENFYGAEAPHWPDEEAENAIRYPVRFGIEPLAVLHDVSLDEDGPLGLAASDAIRVSGTQRGIGMLVDMDPQSLLDAAGIPANWSEEQTVALNHTPGFTEEQVKPPKQPKRPSSGAGFVFDPKKRKAIELHAEDMAAAHYEGEGWIVERLGKPYDLRCTREREERRVEVKGTTGAATSVDLTINEVEHARDPQNTVDLFVVSDIKVDLRTDTYTASGGRVLHLHDWAPAEADLRPRSFEYRLPLA
ncbi:protein NO VEIN domain-containing protein [Streptomyces sp. NPDC005551]|uniref:protein NO VEIN domain-containing protein n=1 Tax=Streptomyces sp. NPDC005551 TaxID=3364725 RepID=UPI0036D16BD5